MASKSRALHTCRTRSSGERPLPQPAQLWYASGDSNGRRSLAQRGRDLPTLAATSIENYETFSIVSRLNHGQSIFRMSRIVITGGPGAGKTTLLLALQARGHTIVGDSPRTIIQDRRRRGLSPRPNAYEFVHQTLRMDIENYVHHAATPGYVFFERSVLDALCGLDRIAPLSEGELRVWLSKYQYCSKVFVLPPWKAIYANDDERDHTFEHAESVYQILQEWYHRLEQYQVIEVPKVSVAERCAY